MKAIIFSGSAKQAKYSDSKRWSDLLKIKFAENDISSDVIHLRDFDYEATTSGDILLPQLKKIYEANVVVFAGPIIHCLVAFPLYNLWHRLRKAHERATAVGIDIFKNKYFDVCVLGGGFMEYEEKETRFYKNDWDKKHGINYNKRRKKTYVEYYGRQHNIVYDKLDFFKNLGQDRLALSCKSPMDPTGPDSLDMDKDKKVLEDIEKLIAKIKVVCLNDCTPHCSKKEFEGFMEDSEGEFGRGMTVSEKNLTLENVEQSIKRVSEDKNLDTITKGQITLCMKERADRAGKHELAFRYYRELFRLIEQEGFRCITAGLHRPSNY